MSAQKQTISNAAFLAKRERLLGPTYHHFYADPVHIVRAKGVWMYDADGKAYLDAYNNVPVVGHCHPDVVAALTHQAETLNTHTRYFTDTPLELAERLLGTMPKEVSNIIYTCTGSEANDLAVRISRAITGQEGVIIVEGAYHGTTAIISGMSPAYGQKPGPGVYTVPVPLGTKTASFADSIKLCIAKMQEDGIKPAALMVDTIFSSNGVIDGPIGFLKDAVEAIQQAGGLFIADEVQPGFGRTGKHMWGFQRHGIVPDFVTMGKPMGNGHPIAAMVTKADIMATFAKGTRYFNTFGGNTVSCAVGLAVLGVLEKEQLIQNAHDRGKELKTGLKQISGRYSWMGDVRGAGLFLGLDIKANPFLDNSNTEEAARIVNELRSNGVLIGASGKNAATLKIRPPLPVKASEITLLLEKLEAAITKVGKD